VRKIILFLLLAIAVYWWLRMRRSAVGRDDAKAPDDAETMVSCTYCGLHVPLKESVAGGGRYYCGEEHRQLDAGGRRG
jgi:uncharacterized protein